MGYDRALEDSRLTRCTFVDRKIEPRKFLLPTNEGYFSAAVFWLATRLFFPGALDSRLAFWLAILDACGR